MGNSITKEALMLTTDFAKHVKREYLADIDPKCIMECDKGLTLGKAIKLALDYQCNSTLYVPVLKLANWGGFWYMDGDTLKVVTKDGESFDTPHYKYMCVNEWQVVLIKIFGGKW